MNAQRTARNERRTGAAAIFTSASRRALAALLTALAAGCGGDQGPPRYDLSGKVTWKGQPVPRGYVIFTPDAARGNSGPGAQADILDGSFSTPKGQGTIGGPHIATVAGFDGVAYEAGGQMNPTGKPLFPEQKVPIDLPKQAGRQDLILNGP